MVLTDMDARRMLEIAAAVEVLAQEVLEDGTP